MTHTERPAFRPTASCIRTSFLSSGKRHLILTGTRGSGKTTLLNDLLPTPLPGLTTYAIPGDSVRLRENSSGEEAQIGIFDASLPGPENRMQPLAEGFSSLGIPALERCGASDSPWISIDEIGYLEAASPPFQAALLRLLEQKRVAAVVRKQALPFLQALCARPDVFTVDLDAPFGNFGCVIMASGLGRRFGGNKLMADFRGRPLICGALDATEGIFARRVVVTRHRDLAALCRERGIVAVLHDLPHRSDTVRLGVEAIGGEVDGCLFCAGDQPLLQRDTVAALAQAAANDDFSVWRTVYGDTVGSPVLFPRRLFADLAALPEGLGGSHILKKYPEQVRTVPVRDIYELKDIDTQKDLSFLTEQ